VAKPSLPFDPVAEAARQWRDRGWDEAARGMAAVTSIMRVQQVFLGRVDQLLRGFELTFARYEVLMLLSFSRTGALPLGKVGERLQVHPASVTNAIDRLERQGLVERERCGEDARGWFAVLTGEGARALRRARPTHLEGVRRRFLGVLAQDELARLAEVWERLDK
jgi:DNA-binding MarR family transcriptional regulator